MRYEQLWAPWRLGYLIGDEADDEADRAVPQWLPGADTSCFICRDVATPPDDRRNLVVARGERTIAILNRYPYNNGHVLVAPISHQGELDQVDDLSHVEAMHTLSRIIGVIRKQMNAEGFNVGLNLGKVAGAGLPGHLHWHIVPRWNGDTNFMPVMAGIRVIPQSLDALWEFLSDALRSDRG
jgi:ATP adenylyltransferase